MNNIEHKGDASDWLRLDRQVCFPLYAATNLMQRLYRPLLAPLHLLCGVDHLGMRYVHQHWVQVEFGDAGGPPS